MTYLTRIDVTKIDFGWDPDQRVLKVTAALDAQRANLRAATDPHNRDVATRNVADLKQALERAEANEAAWQKITQEIEAAEAAKQQEHDDRALAAITDQLRRDFMAQPGATLRQPLRFMTPWWRPRSIWGESRRRHRTSKACLVWQIASRGR